MPLIRLSILFTLRGFPGGSEGKESAYNAGDPGLIPGSERSHEGNGNPLQYSCLKNSLDKRSLMGYCPRGGQESDTTERLLLTLTQPMEYKVPGRREGLQGTHFASDSGGWSLTESWVAPP